MLIAPLLEKSGHNVKIYDAALSGWNNQKMIDEKNKIISIGDTDEDIAKEVSNFAPDVVAISVLFSNLLESAHNIARIVKKVNKNIKVVLGGNHISCAVTDYQVSAAEGLSKFPKTIQDLENDHFDFALTGEGEFTFPQLVDALLNKENVDKIPGLVRKIKPKKYLINPPSRVP